MSPSYDETSAIRILYSIVLFMRKSFKWIPFPCLYTVQRIYGIQNLHSSASKSSNRLKIEKSELMGLKNIYF